jgi:hypothetical protein
MRNSLAALRCMPLLGVGGFRSFVFAGTGHSALHIESKESTAGTWVVGDGVR